MLDEACFQQMRLEFVGDKQWIQFGNGFDVNDRHEITAQRVGGDLVVPANSTWTRVPVPGCIINGAREKKPCLGPTFPPHLDAMTFTYGAPSSLGGIPGLYGYGSGHCMGNLSKDPNVVCTLQEYKDASFAFGIVDKVRVPESLAPGDYVLSFRWDCEQVPHRPSARSLEAVIGRAES